MTQVYIFDPISAEKKPITYKLLEGITGRTKSNLYSYKSRGTFLADIKGYIVDDETPKERLHELMAKVKLKDEVWVTLRAFKKYQISNYGRIRRKETRRFIMPFASTSKEQSETVRYRGRFLKINLYDDNSKSKQVRVASLMRDTFMVIPKHIKKPVVYHIDQNFWNNRLENLKIVEKAEVLKKQSRKWCKPVVQVCPVTGEEYEYPSLTAAGKSVFVSRDAIRQAIVGSIQTAAGYKWRWLNEDEEIA